MSLSVLDIPYNHGIVDSFQIGIHFFSGTLHGSNVRKSAGLQIFCKSLLFVQLCDFKEFTEGQGEHSDFYISAGQ